MIGSGAFLAAASKGPVSAVVTVLELGQNVSLLIVPLLVAVAGATLVMRVADAPSIYSARLRSGAAKAVAPTAAASTAFDGLISRDFTTISAAAHPAITLQRLVLLQDGTRAKPLYVIDEKGRLAGRLDAQSLGRRDDIHRPLEMSTACDLAEPIAAVGSDVSRSEALAAIGASEMDELPVVSSKTGKIIGVLRRPGLRK